MGDVLREIAGLQPRPLIAGFGASVVLSSLLDTPMEWIVPLVVIAYVLFVINPLSQARQGAAD